MFENGLMYVTNDEKKRIECPHSGIDDKVYLTSKDRMELSKQKFSYRRYKFQPVLRRYIPKALEDWRTVIRGKRKNIISKTELRPLGLMIIKDRVMTTILSFALTAKW